MPIPSGYAQSNLIFTGASVRNGAEVTMGWDLDQFSGGAADLAELIRDEAVTHLMTTLVSTLTLSGVLVKFGPDSTGPSALVSAATSGGDTGPGASSAVTYLVRKHTNFGGRAGRGRMYLPGVAESAVGPDGLVAPAKQSALETDVADWLNAVVSGGATPVLLHGDGSPLTTPSPIVATSVDSYVATQRRRQRA